MSFLLTLLGRVWIEVFEMLVMLRLHSRMSRYRFDTVTSAVPVKDNNIIMFMALVIETTQKDFYDIPSIYSMCVRTEDLTVCQSLLVLDLCSVANLRKDNYLMNVLLCPMFAILKTRFLSDVEL